MMNGREVLMFYRFAMHSDPRNDLMKGMPAGLTEQQMEALAIERLGVWVDVLADVPFSEGRDILKEIYSKPQMLVLQPGHVKVAWEELKARRERTIRSIKRVDRYLRAFGGEDPREVVEERLELRKELLGDLPERVVKQLGLERPPIEPPAPKNAITTTHKTDFSAMLKRP